MRMAIQRFAVPTMSSGATLTSAIDVGPESYDRISLAVPTMTSGTNIYVQGSYDNSTFFRCNFAPSSGVVTAANLEIGSGVSIAIVPLPGVNCRYLKVEHSTACTATAHNYYVILA